MYGSYHMKRVHYTPAGCVAASITEPLLAGIAVHNTRWIVDTAVAEEQQNKLNLEEVHRIHKVYFLCIILSFREVSILYFTCNVFLLN